MIGKYKQIGCKDTIIFKIWIQNYLSQNTIFFWGGWICHCVTWACLCHHGWDDMWDENCKHEKCRKIPCHIYEKFNV